MENERVFNELVSKISGAKPGKIFGASCMKSGNKTAAIFWKNEMLFKLESKDQQEALLLEGSYPSKHLYSDKKMMGWVTITESHSGKWLFFATKAIRYVSTLSS
jgi:hypothetical protein